MTAVKRVLEYEFRIEKFAEDLV